MEGLNANTIRIEIDLQTTFDISWISWLVGESLETLSWSQIQLISEAGLASQVFNVGDEKNVLLGATSYTFVILGFDHDDKFDDSGKAGITFGMKNLLASTYNMNSSSTNSGGWEGSAMRTRMATFFGQLPSDLQSAIKTVNKLATAGNQSTDIIASEDKLFLFSESEINGEGTQYAYWVGKGASDRIKRLSNGSGDTYYWWLRSPDVSYNGGFRCFTDSGGIRGINAGITNGVCFGFCV